MAQPFLSHQLLTLTGRTPAPPSRPALQISVHSRHRHVTGSMLTSSNGALHREDTVTAGSLSTARAAAIVARLALDLDDGICHACLCFVSFAIDRGDEREVQRQVRKMTPDLWHDGLDTQAFAAVRTACAAGVPDADQALADLEARGGRGVVARAIVRRLAGELARRAARDPWLNPELNRARPPDGAAWN